MVRTRIAFYTFGCRLNQAETAIMSQGFDERQYEVVDYRDTPDVMIVNTCTVTENGDADARRLVNRAVRGNPQVKIALVGCQAQVQREKLLELPNVHWVVGNARKLEMAQILREAAADSPRLITPTIKAQSFTLPHAGVDRNHTRANLKIQDGCDFFCSFCEIPYARGRARSRVFEDLVDEARELVGAGHHELILTGINIGTYTHQGRSLVEILSALETIEQLWRIRISSIEPTTIDDAVIARLGKPGKLCRHLHVPLQSGSNTVLEQMNRKYTVEEFEGFLRGVLETCPEACLGTDVIVGFPGETESHFEETRRFLAELPLAYFHVFSYSQRDHARTRRWDESLDVSRAEIVRRSRILRELSARKRREYQQRFLGQTVEVLFEQKKNEWWTGLTDTYIRVRVKSAEKLANRLLPVRLEKIEGQLVTGTLR